MKLRGYQEKLIEGIRNEFRKGNKRPLAVMPPGAGKTVAFADMASKHISLKDDNFVLFLVHRTELVDQTLETFKKIGLDTDKIFIGMVQSFRKYAHLEPSLIIADECFSGDTEILTNKGFIRFDQLGDEKVAQYNSDTTIEFLEPTRKIKRWHDGNMISLHLNRGAHALMTPNHNQVYLNMSNEIITKEIKDVNNGRMIVSGKGVGESKLTWFDKLLIMTQADGYKTPRNQNQYQISLSKDRKLDRLFEIVNNLDIDIRLKEVKDRTGRRRFTYYLPKGIEPKLLSNVFNLEDFSYEKARDFIDEICIWDGYQKDGVNQNYDSRVKENVDFVSAVASLAGYRNYTVKKVDNRSETFSDIYRVFFVDKEINSKTLQPFKKQNVEYNDYVYCVEVPSHMIVVRSQGQTFVSGNCHHMVSNTWYRTVEQWPDVPFVGLTATPRRLDGEPLTKVFDSIVEGPDANWLIENNYLAPYRWFAPKLNVDIKTRGKDYDLDDLSIQMMTQKIYGDIEKYLDPNKKTIIYAPSIKFSQELEKQFSFVKHFDGNTPAKERDKIVEDFRLGKIRALTNVDLISEGFDIPDCDTVMLLRPTKSLTLFIQQSMRGMRYLPGKTATVYDMVGNVFNFGFPTDYKDWDLETKIRVYNKTEVDEVKARRCDNCLLVYPGINPICLYCGHDNGKTRREIRQEREAELEEIKRVEKIEQVMAKDYKSLLALAIKRGYKNPQAWAHFVNKSRKRK